MIKYIHYMRFASGKRKRNVKHIYESEERAMMALELCGGRVEVVEVKEVITKGSL